MKFLVDAQLPLRLARQLSAAGHDVVHTSELPDGNRTTDAAITERADAEERAVVTKDRDFRDSHLLVAVPRRLLIVATGNINNSDSSRCSIGTSKPSSPLWRRSGSSSWLLTG